MKRVKGWWDEKLIPPDSPTGDDTGNNSAYQKGQAAFVLNPPSIYGWMVQNDKQLLDNSTMAAMPAGKSGSYSGSGSWSRSMAPWSPGSTARAPPITTYRSGSGDRWWIGPAGRAAATASAARCARRRASRCTNRERR